MLDIECLIVGCGRSGTSFLSNSLTGSGLDAAHEEAFDLYGINPAARNSIECSWYAVPYLPLISERVKIVHIFRRPEKVVASFYRLGVMSRGYWRHVSKGRPGRFFFRSLTRPENAFARIAFSVHHKRFLQRHLGVDDWSRSAEIQRLEHYWIEWNTSILHHCTRPEVRSIAIDIDKFESEREKLENFLGASIKIDSGMRSNLKNDYRTRALPPDWKPSKHAEAVWSALECRSNDDGQTAPGRHSAV